MRFGSKCQLYIFRVYARIILHRLSLNERKVTKLYAIRENYVHDIELSSFRVGNTQINHIHRT